jgi:cell wall-associated NlpC family hydrolase
VIHALRPALSRTVVAVSFAGAMALAPVAPAFAHPTSTASATTTTEAEAAVDAALDQVGTPYVWGGNSPSGFDCSGLTSWAYAEAGVTIPRTSRGQHAELTSVKRSDLQVGDLVFFYSPVGHVAIYIGDGKIVESPSRGKSVRVAELEHRSPSGYGRP